MACRDTLPFDKSLLLEYLEQLPYESDSEDDEFEGYLGSDDGPIIKIFTSIFYTKLKNWAEKTIYFRKNSMASEKIEEKWIAYSY